MDSSDLIRRLSRGSGGGVAPPMAVIADDVVRLKAPGSVFPEGGIGGGGGGCQTGCAPDGTPITVSISGILVDCGCVDTSPIYGPSSIIATDVSVNSVWGGISSFGGGVWSGTTDITGHLIEWNMNNTCSGDPSVDSDNSVNILALCDETGWSCLIRATDGAALFYGTGVSPCGIPNQFSCGELISTFLGNQMGVGHGGTVTISW